jgi:hypothetical protein
VADTGHTAAAHMGIVHGAVHGVVHGVAHMAAARTAAARMAAVVVVHGRMVVVHIVAVEGALEEGHNHHRHIPGEVDMTAEEEHRNHRHGGLLQGRSLARDSQTSRFQNDFVTRFESRE